MEKGYIKTADSAAGTRTKANKEVDSLAQYAETIDLCFLVDCTGSMSGTIKSVAENIFSINEDLLNKLEKPNLRLSFISYRDYDVDQSKLVEIQPFTDVKQFKQFVSKVKAEGGGDTCEDIHGGLIALNNLNWRNYANRIVIHFADAPCHGSDFNGGNNDSYSEYPTKCPSYVQSRESIKETLHTLARNKINYIFSKINDTTDKMIEKFNELLKEGGYTYEIKQVPAPASGSFVPVIVNYIKDRVDAAKKNPKDAIATGGLFDFAPKISQELKKKLVGFLEKNFLDAKQMITCDANDFDFKESLNGLKEEEDWKENKKVFHGLRLAYKRTKK